MAMEAKTFKPSRSVTSLRLVEARQTLGLTKEDVTGVLGFDLVRLDNLEAGSQTPTDLELRRLARLYRRNVAWILGEEDDAALSRDFYASVERLAQDDKEKVLQFARFLAAQSN